MVTFKSEITQNNNGDQEKIFSVLSPLSNEEIQLLKFYSDNQGFFISSSIVEKYGDEPVYFSCRMSKAEFKTLLSNLMQLYQDRQKT
jgi:hypothetical protein